MRRVVHVISTTILLLQALSTSAVAQIHPSPVTSEKPALDPYKYTGVIVSEYSTGSAAVVSHPNVAVSCAHVVFNEYTPYHPWLPDNFWYGAWNKGAFPSPSEGQALRGYLFFSSYAANALTRGLASAQTFANDFTVHYSYEPLAEGAFAPASIDGGAAARSGAAKLITGYPAGLYPYGSSNAYLMHSVGPFTNIFQRVHENYHETVGVSTGAGNSGGPLWVYQDTQAQFAGVIVSGLEKSTGGGIDLAGIRALDKKASELIDKSIAALTSGKVGTIPSEQDSGPDIKIYGNAGLIENGDRSPSRYDNTLFGSIADDKSTITRTFVIKNEGGEALTLSGQQIVSIEGKDKRLFRVIRAPQNTIRSLESAPFRIRFNSKRKGTFSSTIRVQSNDADETSYSFMVEATRN